MDTEHLLTDQEVFNLLNTIRASLQIMAASRQRAEGGVGDDPAEEAAGLDSFQVLRAAGMR